MKYCLIFWLSKLDIILNCTFRSFAGVCLSKAVFAARFCREGGSRIGWILRGVETVVTIRLAGIAADEVLVARLTFGKVKTASTTGWYRWRRGGLDSFFLLAATLVATAESVQFTCETRNTMQAETFNSQKTIDRICNITRFYFLIPSSLHNPFWLETLPPFQPTVQHSQPELEVLWLPPVSRKLT